MRLLFWMHLGFVGAAQRTLIAFVAGGCMHSQYHKVLRVYLQNDETIKQMSMPVLELIRDQCKEAKDNVRALSATQLGSWECAVTDPWPS